MDATADPMIRLDAVSKQYGDGTIAVHELDLDVHDGELVVLVGPSGCGKSTTLKMVNRLIQPTSGRILLQGEDVTQVDAVRLRRRMGYVIQQVGLFPHQSVATNVATVPRLLGWDKRRVAARVNELLELVGLEPSTYADRYPHQLSGGQRQRVGVARALAADPPVLLMDEPFGAVDPIVRDRLQDEFLRLQQEVRKTILFVTHDIEEAVRLGDRIAVFSPANRIEQYDEPAKILGAPATDFVAEFVGSDRELKRLSVTPIDVDELEQPPTARADDRLAEVARVMSDAGHRLAVVLNENGAAVGWLSLDDAHGDGTVTSKMRELDATVPAAATLKSAFSTMLQSDVGWVAVLDGSSYLGILGPRTLHRALRKADVSAQGPRRG